MSNLTSTTSPGALALYRPHAEAPASLTRLADHEASSAWSELTAERFELVSRGDFVNGSLARPTAGAAQGLVDVAIATEILRSGQARRALITASGLAGDLAAVVLEAAP